MTVSIILAALGTVAAAVSMLQRISLALRTGSIIVLIVCAFVFLVSFMSVANSQ